MLGTADGGERVAHYAGVQTCGSPWTCPVCAPKIRARRAQEIEAGALTHLRAGGALYTFVLTMPHGTGDDLAELWQTLSDGYRACVSGRAWGSQREALGIVGYVRASEATHGRHGWHPHAHVLLFTERALSGQEQRELSTYLHEHWSRAVQRRGHRAPIKSLLRLLPVRDGAALAGYLQKAALVEDSEAENGVHRRLGHELARADLKRGRQRGRTPWEIARAAAAGDCRSVALWHEWERGSHRRDSVRWSRGLKARLNVAEASDEAHAAAAATTAPTRLFNIEPVEWHAVARTTDGPDAVLRLAETAGAEPARTLVREITAAYIAARTGPGVHPLAFEREMVRRCAAGLAPPRPVRSAPLFLQLERSFVGSLALDGDRVTPEAPLEAPSSARYGALAVSADHRGHSDPCPPR
jgi:hypothetical protein